MSISKMDLDLLVSFIVGPTSVVLVLFLLGFVIKQFYANLHYSRARQKQKSKIREISLVPSHIPFQFELKSSYNNAGSYTNDTNGNGGIEVKKNEIRQIPIEITTTIQTKTNVHFFWGINAKLFLDIILKSQASWINDNHSNFDECNEFDAPWLIELRNLCGNVTSFSIDGAGSSTKQVEIPESVKEIRETMASNLIIPCAVIIVPDEAAAMDERSHMDSTDIRGLIVVLQLNSAASRNIIDIKDRFIKTYSGFSFRLLPLFVQGDSENPSSADTDDQELFRDRSSLGSSRVDQNEKTSENEPFYRIRCILCQTLPISRAILPCGHVCTCAHCFPKLKYCPICRGQIQCFFKTRDESYLNSMPSFMKNTSESSKQHRLTWSEYFEEISEHLNVMLGLPEAN